MGQLVARLAPAPPGLGALLELTPAEAAVWPLAQAEGQAQGVDPRLIMAVVAQESRFNPRATRTEPDGRVSYGLMQLLLETARGLNGFARPEDLYDPALNIRLGTRYLAYQLRRYGGDPAAAVAAYNAGTAYRDAAGRYTSKGGTFDVQAHVDHVLGYFGRYVDILPGGAVGWALVAGGGVALVLVALALRRRRPGS